MTDSEIKVKAGLKTRTIQVDYLARVEGEGALYIRTKGKEVEEVQFKIFEPPRYFEALLRGRDLNEAPDITSRICGICPIAYQMSAVHAMEDALGLEVTPTIRKLRRLIFCGEWIESHSLHLFMLHLPDFLGFEDAIQMARKYPKQVTSGLKLKKAGNDLMTALGGREIHPINVRVGGFYKLPEPSDLDRLLEPLKSARDIAIETIELVAKLDFPDFERDYEFVSLSHPKDYPINEGRLISNRGLDIPTDQYLENFEEIHVERSTALHSVRKGHGEYLVGPLARYFLNSDKLPAAVQEAAGSIGFKREDCRNPFKSIIVRALEILFACEEGLAILETYREEFDPSEPAFIQGACPKGRNAIGHGCTEAPRGILYHRYALDEVGVIQEAKIIPPTSQNQKSIESDLFGVVKKYLASPRAELQHRCEQTIRNYDPCISCSTHFLKIEVENAG